VLHICSEFMVMRLMHTLFSIAVLEVWLIYYLLHASAINMPEITKKTEDRTASINLLNYIVSTIFKALSNRGMPFDLYFMVCHMYDMVCNARDRSPWTHLPPHGIVSYFSNLERCLLIKQEIALRLTFVKLIK
jgi:hypothetical protein